MRTSFVFLFHLISLWHGSSFAIAKEEPKKSLILIGYSDSASIHLDQLSGFNSHRYFPTISSETEKTIHDALLILGFKRYDEDFYSKFVMDFNEIYVLNSNATCEGERTDQSFIRSNDVCQSQKDHSNKTIEFFVNSLNTFDEFFYIGHSRNGQGLGMGPFLKEYTIDLRFFNVTELGNLKKIVLASCESNKFYGTRIIQKENLKLRTTDRELKWIKDLLPMLINELYTSTLEANLK